MPNSIKYSTTTQPLSLKKGDFWIGTGDVDKGPTSQTEFYDGITPSSSGYTIYLNKLTGGPSMYSVSNDSQLVTLTNTNEGTNFTGATQCLNYYAIQTQKMAVNIDYPSIVTNGLQTNIDAGFTPSYSRSGTTFYNVGIRENSTLENGPVWSGTSGGQIILDGVDDFINLNTFPNISFSGGITIEIVVRLASLGAGGWERFVDMRSASGDGSFISFGRHSIFQNIFFQCANISGGDTQRRYQSSGNPLNANEIAIFAVSMGAGTPGNPNSNVNLYKNGSVLSGTFVEGNPRTPSTTIRNQCWTGRSPFVGNSFLNGGVYQLRIYNRGLSNSEILQNYNVMKGRYGLS